MRKLQTAQTLSADTNARNASDGGGQPLDSPAEKIPANRGAAPSRASSAITPPLTPLTPLDQQPVVDPKQFRKALSEKEAREQRQQRRDEQRRTCLLFVVCAFAGVVATLTVLAMAVFDMSEPGPVTDDEPLPSTTNSNDSRDNVDRRLREASDEFVEPWQTTSDDSIDNGSDESALLADRFADGEIA
ncbi:hypothetical protein MRX96_028502 [Rhipicephalus microplus]